jgi:hypothetical protein
MYNFSLPKVDGVSTQPAAEMNSVFNELEGIVTDSGQALSNGDNTQLEKAVSVYSAGGNYYVDSGTAGAYVVAPIGSKKSPPAYFEGMCVKFIAGNTCAATPTINVNSLGVKNIKRWDGSAIAAGDILVDQEVLLTYDGTQFLLPGVSAAQFVGSVSGNGYQKLPGGLIIQWGTFTTNATPGDPVAVSFTLTFPTGVLAYSAAVGNTSTSSSTAWFSAGLAASGGNVHSNVPSVSGTYIVLGY